MKGHPHAKLAQQFWAEMEENDQAYRNWEWQLGRSGPWNIVPKNPTFSDGSGYRRKPKTHVVNGFEVPSPETKPIEPGKVYWTADPANAHWTDVNNSWEDDMYDMRWLQRGLIHLTKEAAITNTKAMCGIDPYNTDED